MGARRAGGPDAAARGASGGRDRLARGRARALYPAASFHQVRAAASGPLVVAAPVLQPRRPAPAAVRPPSSEGPAPPCGGARRTLAVGPSGRQRIVGRNPALLFAQRDGAEGARLSK